jgi:plastocyanin
VRRVLSTWRAPILASVVCVAGCSGTPSTPSAPPAGTVTITAAGVTPSEIHIRRFGHVTFVNTDTRAHAISSDPVTLHTDCPATNEVGIIDPGQSRATGTFSVPGVCGFHDHIREFDPTFKGRIVVE